MTEQDIQVDTIKKYLFGFIYELWAEADVDEQAIAEALHQLTERWDEITHQAEEE